MAKEFSKSFYNSKTWHNCRAGYIKSVFGLCEDCRDRGIVRPGYEVHHTIELTPDNINNPEISLNWEYLRYLCHGCHNRINSTEVVGEGLMFDSMGQLVKQS
jgi:5-methylcytosine-specific restriction protein A